MRNGVEALTKILWAISSYTTCKSNAYKLTLLEGSCVHPTFHISCLKKKVGDHVHTQTKLSAIIDEGVMQVHPKAILDRRIRL